MLFSIYLVQYILSRVYRPLSSFDLAADRRAWLPAEIKQGGVDGLDSPESSEERRPI
jgi:hypothetical protein